jgi:anti-sigma B factor antagonist
MLGLHIDINVSAGDGGGGDVAIIRCEGDLDMATAARLIDAFDRVGFERPQSVQVDLRGVEFMDSTGLGCLAHGAMLFQKQGARFDVLPSEPVSRVIDKGGLKTLLCAAE